MYHVITYDRLILYLTFINFMILNHVHVHIELKFNFMMLIMLYAHGCFCAVKMLYISLVLVNEVIFSHGNDTFSMHSNSTQCGYISLIIRV